MEYSLERIRRVAKQTLKGLPYIHVTGTHGKGSTVALLVAALRANGVKVGSFTSPHLCHPRDAIQVNGEAMPLEDWQLWTERIEGEALGLQINLSSFEIQTLVAFSWLQACGVRLAVIEVGMGGCLDATNVLEGPWQLAALVGPIGLDHQAWLGPDLLDICRHKLGILRPGKPVMVSPQHDPRLMPFILNTAKVLGCPVTLVTEPYAGFVSLRGRHQRWNAAMAQACLQTLGYLKIDFSQAYWPGRLSKLNLNGLACLIDGAHTPEAAATVREYFKEHRQPQNNTMTWMVGQSGGRDPVAFCQELDLHPGDTLIQTGFSTPLGMDWITAQGPWDCHHVGVTVLYAKDIREALNLAPPRQPTIITGSLYLISDLYRWLEGGPGNLEVT